jgi:hypothetical protein
MHTCTAQRCTWEPFRPGDWPSLLAHITSHCLLLTPGSCRLAPAGAPAQLQLRLPLDQAVSLQLTLAKNQPACCGLNSKQGSHLLLLGASTTCCATRLASSATLAHNQAPTSHQLKVLSQPESTSAPGTGGELQKWNSWLPIHRECSVHLTGTPPPRTQHQQRSNGILIILTLCAQQNSTATPNNTPQNTPSAQQETVSVLPSLHVCLRSAFSLSIRGPS